MDYTGTIKKLQYAINQDGRFTLMYNVNQFYSREQRRPINMYVLKQASFDEEKGKNAYTEIFKTARQLYIIFFLRNLWYYLQEQEIPSTDFPDFEQLWKTFAEEFLA